MTYLSTGCSLGLTAAVTSISRRFTALSSSWGASALRFKAVTSSRLDSPPGNKQWSVIPKLRGTTFVSGIPVIWHRHPFGKDVNTDVSSIRCSITSTPILKGSMVRRMLSCKNPRANTSGARSPSLGFSKL